MFWKLILAVHMYPPVLVGRVCRLSDKKLLAAHPVFIQREGNHLSAPMSFSAIRVSLNSRKESYFDHIPAGKFKSMTNVQPLLRLL